MITCLDCMLPDEWGSTPLLNVSKVGHSKCIQQLLVSGENPNFKDRYNNTALMNAVCNGNIACVKILLEGGHTESVRILLDAGANPDLRDIDGTTTLMHTARHGDVECTNILLKAGADTSLINIHGETALSSATGECVNILKKWDDISHS